MSVVAFAGLVRFNDLVRLRRSDLRFNSDHLRIVIRSSKTDPYQKGQEVFVSRLPGQFCPVKILWDYLGHANQSSIDHSDLFIFRRTVGKGSKASLTSKDEHLSYSSARSSLKKSLKTIGIDPKYFGLHCFRIGGSSAAHANGCDGEEIQSLLTADGVRPQQRIFTSDPVLKRS